MKIIANTFSNNNYHSIDLIIKIIFKLIIFDGNQIKSLNKKQQNQYFYQLY